MPQKQVVWDKQIVMAGFHLIFLTLRASLRLPYTALLRVRRKKHYDFTLRCLAYESLRPVQKLGTIILSRAGEFLLISLVIPAKAGIQKAIC